MNIPYLICKTAKESVQKTIVVTVPSSSKRSVLHMWLDMVAATNSNFGIEVDLCGARRDFPNKKLQEILPSAQTARKYETERYPWLKASQNWCNSR